MADNGYTKNYANGSALTETQLDTAYKSLKLDISNTTQMTQGATAGHYLKCVTPGSAAQFAALPSDLVSSKSADYIITDTDGIYTVLVTTGTAAITITLPTAADNEDRIIVIKKVDSGTGTVIIEGEAAETIDGDLNKQLLSQYESLTVQCNGAEWFIINNNAITIKTIRVSTATNVGATNTYFDMGSVSLGKGTWEISANAFYIRQGATFTTSVDCEVGIGQNAGTVATDLIQGVNFAIVNTGATNTPTAFGQWSVSITGYIVTLNTATTHYLKGYLNNFSSGTPQYTGSLTARRIKP